MGVFGILTFTIIILFIFFDFKKQHIQNKPLDVKCQQMIKKTHDFEAFLDCEIRPDLTEKNLKKMLKYSIDCSEECTNLPLKEKEFVLHIMSRLYDYKFAIETNNTSSKDRRLKENVQL